MLRHLGLVGIFKMVMAGNDKMAWDIGICLAFVVLAMYVAWVDIHDYINSWERISSRFII